MKGAANCRVHCELQNAVTTLGVRHYCYLSEPKEKVGPLPPVVGQIAETKEAAVRVKVSLYTL